MFFLGWQALKNQKYLDVKSLKVPSSVSTYYVRLNIPVFVYFCENVENLETLVHDIYGGPTRFLVSVLIIVYQTPLNGQG